MANAFSKNELVLFDEILEKFDPNNISAKQVEVDRPDMTAQERAGYRIWKPMPYIARTVQGLDITGAFKNLTQLSVPCDIDTIENFPFQMNAKQLNDPLQRTRAAEAGIQALSAIVDRAVATLVGITGGLFLTSAAAASGYKDIAAMETRMINEDINTGAPRTAILNATDYEGMADNLANRETMTGKPNTAYERSYVGPVAGFDTFRTSFQPTLEAYAGGAVTTGGTAQSHVPMATAPNAVNGGQSNVDNRFFNLTVDATTNVKPGDAFTVPGVFAVSAIHKNVTAHRRTFRVVEVVDGTTLKITPAPVVAGASDAEDAYANVSAAIPATTQLDFQNTTTAPVNTFWDNQSIEITEGSLAVPEDDMAGVASTEGQTDSGVRILFAKGGDVGSLVASYRLTIFFGVTNKQPMMNGAKVFNQT